MKKDETSIVRERVLWIGVLFLTVVVFLVIVLTSPLSFSNMDAEREPIMIVKSTVENAQENGTTQTTDPSRNGKVNLNTASLEELQSVPGVGEVLAKHILIYRESHNGFSSIQELKEVEGIGDTRFASLKPYFTVG